MKPGTLSREQVNATVHAHGSEIEQCYERARMDSADLAVRVGVRIQVSGDGRVNDVSVSSNRPGMARLQSCVSGAIRRWTFPAPAGGAPGAVVYTFVFGQ